MYRTAKLTISALGKPSRSPKPVVTISLRSSAGSACCSVMAKFSITTMARAPESFIWCSSSGGVYSGLTLTTTQPARNTPATATGYCGTLGIISATRSPLARPAACRKAANWRDISSTSPKLKLRPM